MFWLQVSQKVHCMVLNEEEDNQEAEDKDKMNKDKEVTGHNKEEAVVKLVNKVAGKKSNWKIVEREFIQVCGYFLSTLCFSVRVPYS
jgi:hypothetical protein